jgi:hypothetical protein
MPKWVQRSMECEINGLSGFSPKLDPSFDFRCMYPLTDTWDPPFGVSLFDFRSCVDDATPLLESRNPETRLVPNNYYPSTFSIIFPFLLRDFANREFETLDSKVSASSTSRTPENRNAEIPHQRHTVFHDFNIFNAKSPSSFSLEFPVC